MGYAHSEDSEISGKGTLRLIIKGVGRFGWQGFMIMSRDYGNGSSLSGVLELRS